MPVENSKQRSDWRRRKESRERREDGRATYFDGSAYTAATGVAPHDDSGSGTFSAWTYTHRDDVVQSLLRTTLALQRFQVQLAGGPRLSILGRDTSGNLVLQGVGTPAPDGIGDTFDWHHLLISYDLAGSPVIKMYVDDIEQTVTPVVATADAKIGLSQVEEWALGAQLDGSNPLFGAVFNMWFQPDLYVDLDDVEVRRQFITAGKRPVYLGRTGDRPFGLGTPPYIFFQGGPNLFRRARGLQATDYNEGAGTILPRSGPPVASFGD